MYDTGHETLEGAVDVAYEESGITRFCPCCHVESMVLLFEMVSKVIDVNWLLTNGVNPLMVV